MENETRKPHDRRPGESAQAYEAFSLYCDMRADRSLVNVAQKLHKSTAVMARWSGQHEWVARVLAFDDERDRLEQAAKAKVAAEHAALWEKRRLQAAAQNWNHANRLGRKAAEMLGFPLSEDTVDEADENGNPVKVTRNPVKWNMATAGAMLKIAAELKAAAIAEATGQADDGFDPATASVEECRAYLAREGMLRIASGTDGSGK